MGRHYLPRSDRHPRKLRRLRRSWPAVGTTGVSAPNMSTPAKVNDIQWAFEVQAPAPKVGTTYTITIKQAVIATGAALADIVINFTGAANDTKAQLATKAAAALDAHADVTSPVPSTSFVTFGLANVANKITFASLTGAPTAAIIPAANEAEGASAEPFAEPAPAPPASKKAKSLFRSK